MAGPGAEDHFTRGSRRSSTLIFPFCHDFIVALALVLVRSQPVTLPVIAIVKLVSSAVNLTHGFIPQWRPRRTNGLPTQMKRFD